MKLSEYYGSDAKTRKLERRSSAKDKSEVQELKKVESLEKLVAEKPVENTEMMNKLLDEKIRQIIPRVDGVLGIAPGASPIIRPKIATDDTLKEKAVTAPTILKEPGGRRRHRRNRRSPPHHTPPQSLGAPPQRPSTTQEMTYYVVFEGRVPGVHEEWEECKKQVHKFSGNCYKGYPTRHEAFGKWRKHPLNKSKMKMKTFLMLSLLLTIVAAVLYFILV
ncbi:hypothetical protein QYE76_034507 [Lolium multiflorum]|uniref:Ribonuclease H1 N-terminal domain-containing protein n=1 Tax=Lolium multiflorum TaxID=4521 RepID=A0AAD8VLA8_LOLMU|nr:hypothetical protein QYE76_034507 [Lolium multiflorum]